jgi:hypothetical protein
MMVNGCVPPGPDGRRRTPAGAGLLATGLVVSVAFGVVRGRTLPMWRDADGRLYRKSDRQTFLPWLATLVARLLFGVLGTALLAEAIHAKTLWLGVGVTVGVQQTVMLYRARTLPSRPATSTNGRHRRAGRLLDAVERTTEEQPRSKGGVLVKRWCSDGALFPWHGPGGIVDDLLHNRPSG